MTTRSAPLAPRPSLWRAVVHFDRAKVRPWVGLRNTIGIVLPVVIGAWVGHPSGGLIAGIGALNVAVGDGTDPYLHRARRMTIASVFCAIAVVAGGLAGGTWAVTPILALGAFAAGMMVALGPTEADLGVITLVTLLVFSAQLLTVRQSFINGALALAGGLFQTALSVALWPLRRNLPERRALAALYLELARAAAAAPNVTEAPPASRESTEAQQALVALDARDSIDAERYLALLSQAERLRLSLLTLARLRIRFSREPATECHTTLVDRCASLASQVLKYAGESLGGEDAASPPPSLLPEIEGLAKELRHACRASSASVAALVTDARSQVDALAGQLRAVLDISQQTTRRGLAEFERRQASHPWKLQFAGTRSVLAAAMHWHSATFRHAVRLAVCITVGEALAHGLRWVRPYWVPMTIALVLKPDFTTTFSRGLQRLLGTLIGLVLATALFHFLHPGLVLEIAFLAVFAYLLRGYGPANYGILAIAVTALVVFLLAVTGVSPGQVMLARGLDTLAGGFIALLAYRLWPTWERTQVPEALAQMLDSYRAYFQAVRDGYLKPEEALGVRLDQARLNSRIARSHFEASVARMRAEPASDAHAVAAFDRILANSHRFIHAVMSLEAGLLSSRPVPARDAFRALSNDVDATIYYLSAGLRGRTIKTSEFPNLREDHQVLIETGDSQIERYALVNTETDRIVNSLNTSTGEILEVIESRNGGHLEAS